MRRAWTRGSFTVEASLLMAILIPLFVSILYLGFYLHNRAFLKGAAYELAEIGLLYDGEEDALRAMEQRKRQLLNGYLLGGGRMTGTASLGQEEVRVTLKSSLRVPGTVAKLFLGNRLTMQADASLKRDRPALAILRGNRRKKWKEEGNGDGSVLQKG